MNYCPVSFLLRPLPMRPESLNPVTVQSANAHTSPLCIEEFDLSDRNFRPCPCGYQVCRHKPLPAA